ncbi:MAG: DUF4367 domain-containing protein [Tissierellaceae bacterium]
MRDEVLTDEALDRLLVEYMPKANMLIEQLEEERDKNLEPHVFSRRYRKNMKRIIKEYTRTPFQNKLARLGRYAATILLIFILTNGVLIATAEGYRERVFNAITCIYEKFTSIIIDVDEPIDTKNTEIEFIEPSYIPDGYKMIDSAQTDVTRVIKYMDKNNNTIVLKQGVITGGELRIDTEGATIEEIDINDQTIKYFINKETYSADWYDEKYIYSITAEVHFAEFVKILEGIIKK